MWCKEALNPGLSEYRAQHTCQTVPLYPSDYGYCKTGMYKTTINIFKVSLSYCNNSEDGDHSANVLRSRKGIAPE